MKVAQSRLPQYHEEGDLLRLSADRIRSILSSYEHAVVLVAAGFPCQDNSTLKDQRQGIQKAKSGLIFDIAGGSSMIHVVHAEL